MTILIGGNRISSTRNAFNQHHAHVKYVTGHDVSSQKCPVGGIPIVCFDMGDGTFALGVHEVTSGTTDNGEATVISGYRINVSTYTDSYRIIETVKQTGGDAVAARATRWHGTRIGVNEDGSLLVQKLVIGSESEIDLVRVAYVGGVPVRVVRVDTSWYLCIHTNSTVT